MSPFLSLTQPSLASFWSPKVDTAWHASSSAKCNCQRHLRQLWRTEPQCEDCSCLLCSNLHCPSFCCSFDPHSFGADVVLSLWACGSTRTTPASFVSTPLHCCELRWPFWCVPHPRSTTTDDENAQLSWGTPPQPRCSPQKVWVSN